MRPARSRLDLWLTVVSVASVLLTLVAISLSFFTFDRFAETLFNADAIQTPAVFADVFGRGGSFLDWHIAPAPAIVPEYGMFALAYVVGVTYAGRILAYSIIQVLVFWAAVYGLTWAAGLRRPLVTASLTVSVFGLFCLLRVVDFAQLIQSAFHFGGFILQLVTLALIFLLWRGQRARRRGDNIALVSGIAFIAATGSLNDALFVVQLAAPVCLIVGVGVLAGRIPWRNGLGFAAVLAAASLIGWKLYPVVIPNSTSGAGNVDIDADSVGGDFNNFISVWGDAFSRSPMPAILVTVALILGVLGAVLVVRRRNLRWMRGTTIQTLSVFALLSGTLPLVAAFVSSADTTPRYVMPLFYWPVILGAMILTQLDWSHAIVVATAIACVASLMTTGFAVRDVARSGLQSEFYPSSVACLDDVASKYGVTHAIGTYWVAKPTQELSRTGLTVTVLTSNLATRPWVASVANVYPTYDALIDSTSNSNPRILANLKKRYGKPTKSFSCDTVTMWVWRADAIVLPQPNRR